MKLYELFKGTEYVGEFTLDEIVSITGAHRSALLNSVAHGVLVNDLWDVSPAYDRTLNRNDNGSLLKQFEAITYFLGSLGAVRMDSLLKQFEAITGQIRRCVKRE